MKIYEVTLNSGRTDTVRFSSDSFVDVQSIFNVLSDAKVTQVKKVVYSNPSPSVSNTPYYRELKILISNGLKNRFVRIRFLKRVIDKSSLINLIKSYLVIDGKNVNKVQSLVIWQ